MPIRLAFLVVKDPFFWVAVFSAIAAMVSAIFV